MRSLLPRPPRLIPLLLVIPILALCCYPPSCRACRMLTGSASKSKRWKRAF